MDRGHCEWVMKTEVAWKINPILASVKNDVV